MPVMTRYRAAPAPWQLCQKSWRVLDGEGHPIALIYCGAPDKRIPTAMAVTAAPELKAALAKLLDVVLRSDAEGEAAKKRPPTDDEWGRAVTQAAFALARATPP